MLGGITLGGGKGSVTKALVGILIVLLITNGLTTLYARGGVNRMVLAAILLLAAMIDIRWHEEPHAHHQQGLCQPDLSRSAAARRDRNRQGTARSSRTTSCATSS